jgi:hypothetical protein
LNRQWDPRLQMAVNAVLYALIPGALFLVLRRGLTRGFQIFCWMLLAVLGSAPYAATNTLLGFQSQFYFLAGFSLLAIYGLTTGRPGSPPWIAGVLGGAAALVSMASGLLAAAAVVAVLVCAAVRAKAELKRTWPTALAAFGLIAAGFLLRYTPPDHAALAAKSIGDFSRMLLACLSWPNSPQVLLALLSWLPFAVFLVNYLQRRTPPDDATGRFILGVGFWVLLQAAGLAIYRANSGEGLEARYTDILAFGLLANALSAVMLLRDGVFLRRWMPVFAALWLVIGGIGFYSASSVDLAANWKHDMEIRRVAAAAFLATGDERFLERAPAHPDVKHLAALLQDPAIRPILPAGIRPALPLTPRNGSPAPALLQGVSMPDLQNMTAGVWTFPGAFSRFAAIPTSTRFEYAIGGRSGPPGLLFYFLGDRSEAILADVSRSQHSVVPLPSDGEAPAARHGFAFCPGECVLSGSSSAAQLAVMEPKEIGFLSLGALVATQWGYLVMAGGAILFVLLLVPPLARDRKSVD